MWICTKLPRTCRHPLQTCVPLLLTGTLFQESLAYNLLRHLHRFSMEGTYKRSVWMVKRRWDSKIRVRASLLWTHVLCALALFSLAQE